MSFDLGVFYVREDFKKRWYFTVNVHPDDKIQDITQTIDRYAGVAGENLQHAESEERDFTGINAGESFPHFWKLSECGIKEGHAVIAIESRSSRCICEDGTESSPKCSGCNCKNKKETKHECECADCNCGSDPRPGGASCPCIATSGGCARMYPSSLPRRGVSK